MTGVENDDVVRSRYVPRVRVEKNAPLWNGRKKDLFNNLKVANFVLVINVISGRDFEGEMQCFLRYAKLSFLFKVTDAG